MSVTSYTDYLRDLKLTLDRIRNRPFEFENALIQLAICKNGIGYKCRDLLHEGSLYSEHHFGPLNTETWRADSEQLGRAEIDQFFQLPEIYAYSDRALRAEKSPLASAHWDATVAVIDVLVHARGSKARKQRMLFAGFEDRIHAEFFLAVERDLIVNDHQPGSQLFEWRDYLFDEGYPIAFHARSTSRFEFGGLRVGR